MDTFGKVRFPLRLGLLALTATLMCAFVASSHAQATRDEAAVDPPSRVARLSYFEGELGLLPAGATDWTDASINRPLTTGDRLSSGQKARAELELGGGALRIAGQTDLGLLNLNDQLAQIELTQGSLNISVQSLDPGQSYEIDTPTLAFVVDQPGIFRVDIDSNGQSTEVTALDGNATVYGENSAQRPINAGHRYRFDDTGLINGTIADISGGDAFDAWCNDRDRHYAQYATTQYVSQDVVGYQDLAQNGDWDSDSDDGAIWYPADVDSDWAPYQDGSWAYIAPWGWTWVDNARWGFAPYHYGRWAHTHRGWGWVPGPVGVRPVYAPALVAFVGGSTGWGAGARPGYVGLGGAGPIHPIGWFPLGPGEIYDPWYHSSRRYYGNINLSNIRVTHQNRSTIISSIDSQYGHYRAGTPGRGQHYVNRDAPRGFTAVPGAAFASGRNVRSQLIKVDPREVARAPVLARGAVPQPTTGRSAGPRSDHVRSLPLAGFQRHVMARQAPPALPVARAAGAPSRPSADTQRAFLPVAAARSNDHVQVLTRHFGNGPAPGESHLAPAINGRNARTNPGNLSGNAVRAPHPLAPMSNLIPNPPIVTRQDAASTAAPTQNYGLDKGRRAPNGSAENTQTPSRQGALPSARFAHPLGGDQADRAREPTRVQPTVSYISRDSGNPGTGLPQVPQIRRASPVNQPDAYGNVAPHEFNRPQEQQPAQMQQQQMRMRQLQAQQQMQMQQMQLQRQQQTLQMQQERQQQMPMQPQRPPQQMAAPPRPVPPRAQPRQAEHADQH